MSSKSREDLDSVRLLLLGGLGNQLFQMAYGLNCGVATGVTLCRPISASGQAVDTSIDEFNLPSRVLVADFPLRQESRFKLLNLGLRISTTIDLSKATRFIRIKIVKVISKILYFLSAESVQFNYGVGKSSINPDPRKNLHVGYFQYFPPMKVKSELEKLSLKNPSQKFLSMKKELQKTSFLCVHVRLGDYLSDHKIGSPKPKYYISAMRQLSQIKSYDRVYIFSNDINRAKHYFDDSSLNQIYFIGEKDFSPAEAFELMRHAAGYVISNSTFSWWTSVLSYSDNPPVICPDPWFSSLKEPVGLIPESWMRLDRELGI